MRRKVAPRKWQEPTLRLGASAQAAAAAILDAALEQARANARGALESPDPEYLHQLRIGLRRYRSALRLFRDLLRTKRRKRLAREARRLMQPLGNVRDWDVCIEWLRAAKAPQRLLRRARLLREAASGSLEPLDLSRLEATPAAWKRKPRPLEPFSAQALIKARRKVAKRLRGLDWRDAERRHRLRISVKRLRYATDFLDGQSPALEALQDSLGDLNDLAVMRRLLADLQPPAEILRQLNAGERRLLDAARRQAAALQPKD
jgi:CHAD domain-containing protein